MLFPIFTSLLVYLSKPNPIQKYLIFKSRFEHRNFQLVSSSFIFILNLSIVPDINHPNRLYIPYSELLLIPFQSIHITSISFVPTTIKSGENYFNIRPNEYSNPIVPIVQKDIYLDVISEYVFTNMFGFSFDDFLIRILDKDHLLTLNIELYIQNKDKSFFNKPELDIVPLMSFFENEGCPVTQLYRCKVNTFKDLPEEKFSKIREAFVGGDRRDGNEEEML